MTSIVAATQDRKGKRVTKTKVGAKKKHGATEETFFVFLSFDLIEMCEVV